MTYPHPRGPTAEGTPQAALDSITEKRKNGPSRTSPYDTTLTAKRPLDDSIRQIWAFFRFANTLFAQNNPCLREDSMQLTNTVIRPLVATCVGRLNDYALQQDDGRYQRMFTPLSYELLRSHLAGKLTIGSYLITEKNLCRFAVFDADGPRGLLYLLELHATLANLGIGSYLEGSRRGAHLRVFCSAPLSPGVLRAALLPLCPPGVEFYPKQDTASWEHPGSLIRLPLGVHRLSHQRYPFLTYQQDRFDLVAPLVSSTLVWLATVERTPVELLQQLALEHERQAPTTQKYPAKEPPPTSTVAPKTIRAWCAEQHPLTLIGRYVKLDTRGMGCCPFGWHHANGCDHHPSFKVYVPSVPGGYSWYCHVWQQGGSVFDFLQLYYNLETRALWHRILSGEQF